MAERTQGQGGRQGSLSADQFHVNPNGALVIKNDELARAIQATQGEAGPTARGRGQQLTLVVKVGLGSSAS
jgi:hypothetical protein